MTIEGSYFTRLAILEVSGVVYVGVVGMGKDNIATFCACASLLPPFFNLMFCTRSDILPLCVVV